MVCAFCKIGLQKGGAPGKTEGADNMDQYSMVKQQHDRHHAGMWKQLEDQGLRESWQSCINSGLRRDLCVLPCCSHEEMRRIKEKTTKLFAYSNRLICSIFHWCTRTLAFVLVDANGIVLRVYCKGPFASNLTRAGIQEGTDLSENAAGATAFSVGINTKNPYRTSGSDHYLNLFTGMTMYFAPCVLEDNSPEHFGELALLGGIGIITPYTPHYEDYLATAITMTKEVCLHLDMVSTFYNFYLTETLGYICVDIDSNTEEPYCLYHNSNIFNILDIPFSDLCFKRLDSVFDPLPANPEFWEIVQTRKRLHNANIPLCIHGITKQYIVSTDLYRQRKVGYEGVRFFISNTEKISSFVSKQIGNNAILTFNNIIGQSTEIRQTIKYAKKYAEFDNNVLIIGESGVGKDIFAQAIHNSSSRKNGPFIAVNCATFPRDLMVSELFGYEPGAFTGSRKSGNTGKLELANTGTLFLDEIGTLPLDLQAILLRVMETKRFMKLGANKETVVNVRIIAATNENILEMVTQKQFRMDLYFRLSAFVLNIPPLRERQEDVVLLANHFIGVVSSRIHIAPPKISEEAIAYLSKLQWKGNVRELQNMIEGIVQIYSPAVITIDHVTDYMRVVGMIEHASAEKTASTEPIPIREEEGPSHGPGAVTEDQLRRTLEICGGNRSKTAEALGISRKTLYKWIKRFQIQDI